MEQNKIVTYYVIKDLATWTTRGCKQSVCERYEHAEEAMQKFRDYAQWQTVIEDKRIRATLGIHINGLDFDVVYRISGKNALSLEFHLSSFVNEDQKLDRFLPTRQQQDIVEHMTLGAWDNPYFETLPPEHFALFVPDKSLYVCMQTSESGFDYTLYDSQEHLMDGGRLTGNGAWTIWDAMNDLFEELEVDWKKIIVLDHDKVKDWVESGGEK